MSSYIFGERNGIHIIDLQQTVGCLNRALDKIKEFASQNKNILFVGTKRQASEIISKAAVDCKQYYINKRWLGGILTNWDTIQNSIVVYATNNAYHYMQSCQSVRIHRQV